jgi:type VI secretion system protein ImpA
MTDFDLEALLSPLAGGSPCGANLEYEAAFLALDEAARGQPERQYGDTVIAAQEADWPAVRARALELAARTRDLRLAVWLARSGARLDGLAGAVRGLQLVHGLLERHWDEVHPQLEDGDATARLNALRPLAHPSAALADLRAAGIGSERGAVRVRDIELASARAEPLPGESVPDPGALTTAMQRTLAHEPGIDTALQTGADAAQGIADVVERRLGAAAGPDFAPLVGLLRQVAQFGRQAVDAAGAAQTQAHAAAPQHAGAAAPAGPISSREDAIHALQRACEWIELNEPGHPAPLLVRRAQRLMHKNFVDIIRDVLPEGIGEVERLAGIGSGIARE